MPAGHVTSVLLLKRLVNWLMVVNIFRRFLSLVQKESNLPKMYFSLKLNSFAF